MEQPLLAKKAVLLMSDISDSDYQELQSLGATCLCSESGCWYAPEGADLWKFCPWWPDKLRNQVVDKFGVLALNRIKNATSKRIGSSTGDSSQEDGQPSSITLTELKKKIKLAMDSQVCGEFWLVTDIVNITGATHKYFELADYDQRGQVMAQMRGVIFNSAKRVITKFETDTGIKLTRNMRVMIRVQLTYDIKYGESLRILEFSSSFSIGEMERKLNVIRATLSEVGILNANKAIPLPMDYRNVAVISPDGAAGLQDFKTKADILSNHGICNFDYYPALFSGNRCVDSICSAFHKIEGKSQAECEYDAVVIIRGGGDKSGLYALNELEIAKAVCSCEKPVIVGIGHEVDNTILDELAAKRCATPSLAISYLFETIVGVVQKAEADLVRIDKGSTSLLDRSLLKINEDYSNINASANRVINSAVMAYEGIFTNMCNSAEQCLRDADREVCLKFDSTLVSANQKLDDFSAEIKQLMTGIFYNNPMNVIDRGYAVVSSSSGVAGGCENMNVGDPIKVRMKDGSITAQITEIQKNEKNDNDN